MTRVEEWKTWEGRVVEGKFPLRQWLGGSDQSAVFLTERPGQASQKFAIKFIPPPLGDGDVGRQFSRWRSAAQLSHPHLIRIYESGRCQMDGTPLLYVIMEFAEEDLSQVLPQRALSPAEVNDLLPPLLDALSYLHSKGWVHSRIKASNVLAVGDLPKLSSDQVAPPAESAGAGNRRDVYDAPENAAGIVLLASDLWSIGATLVTALTQNPPFEGEASQTDPAVPKAIPEPFRGIARECLHVDPKRRCSVEDILARLQPSARSVPEEDRQPAPPVREVNRRFVAAGLLLAVVLVGLIVFYSFHSHGKRAPQPDASTMESTPQHSPQADPAAAPPVSVAPLPQAAQPARNASSSPGSVQRRVLPDVSRSARNTISGTIKVVVQVEVDVSGKVTTAKFVSAGPSRYFSNLALKAARDWEFSAPVANGQPTASTWQLNFRFQRSSTQVDPERVSR
jgi:TonB family protein